MKNKLAQVIRRILPDTTDRQDGPESFEIRFDADGVKLYLEKVEFERFLSGAGGPNINLQGVVLRMLEEQGLASRFPNGFSLDASVAASLDNEQADILGLPPRFSGEIKVSIDGHSNSKAFTVKIFPVKGGAQMLCRTKGALMDTRSNPVDEGSCDCESERRRWENHDRDQFIVSLSASKTADSHDRSRSPGQCDERAWA
jgi:hypothetical protein